MSSSSTNNTTTTNEYIENKKKNLENDNKKNNWKGFFISFLNFIIFIILLIFFGSIGLYISKIVQSNILPFDLKLKPFGKEPFKTINKEIDINILKLRDSYGFNLFKEPIIKTTKAIFDGQKYINSFDESNNILGFLNKNILKNNFYLYYKNVFSNIISTNNIILNSIFSVINSNNIPEWLIIFLFGLFIIPYLFFSYIFNYIISVIYHILCLKQLWRAKIDENPVNFEKSEWEKEYKISFLRLNKLPIAFVSMFIAFFTSFLIPIIMIFYSLLSPLFILYKSSADNFKSNKNFFNFISSTFWTQKIFILFLLSYKLLSLSYSELGINYFIGFLIGILYITFSLKSFQNK